MGTGRHMQLKRSARRRGRNVPSRRHVLARGRRQEAPKGLLARVAGAAGAVLTSRREQATKRKGIRR